MVPRLKFLIALVLLGCTAAATADPPARVGRLNYMSGIVSFAPGEAQDDWGEAVLNRPLTNGDRLWVERDSRAEFHVGSTAVRMGSHTALDVLNLDDDRLQLRLPEGTLNVRVRDLEQDDVLEIATPSGAVVLREPGSYRVSVDSRNGLARVSVNFGRAEVITPERSFVVPSSQAAVLAAGTAPAFEVAAHNPPDEFDRWSVERDRREDRAASAKYVSRQMTGYEDLDDHGAWRSVPEYGHVWVPSHVPADWAPYRQGHWKWISPWGWTWVDDAPWGFAPFHYGRWVWLGRHWAWAPGPIVRRPVYAPALVAFVGGTGWSVSVSNGPAVGWFPLGWREPFIPWYRASPRHVQNVNVTNVTNVTNVRYVNRSRPEAVTVVSQQAFVSSRPAWQERHRVAREELARAEVINSRGPAEPVRASLASQQPGQRPPPELRTRDVVVTGTASRGDPEQRQAGFGAPRPGSEDDPGTPTHRRLRSQAQAEVNEQRGQPLATPRASRDLGERQQREWRSPPQNDAERGRSEAQLRAQTEQLQREALAQQQQGRQQAQLQAQAEQRQRNAQAQQQAQLRAQAEQREREARAQQQQARARAQQMQPPAQQPQQPIFAQPQGPRGSPQPRQPAGDEMTPNERKAQRQQNRSRND